MSQYNISELGFNLQETLEYLGFQREEVDVPHERDWDYKSHEVHWSYAGEFLFAEHRLTKGLARYFKRLCDALKEIEEIDNEQSGL